MTKFTGINLYDGLRRAYVLTFLLLMEEIEEHGTDHALEMLQRAVEKQADIVAREFKRHIPQDFSPLDIGLEVYTRFMADAGADVEIHSRDKISVTVIVKQCPFFEAILDLGIDCGYFLGGLCSNLTLPSIQAILVRFDSRLKLEAETVRESMEGLCLERIYLHLDE